MSDIVFDATEQVTALCDNFLVQGHDFLLDSPARRGKASLTGYRRAMVHDVGDGLTINFNKDYPGGVTINGDITFEIVHRSLATKSGFLPDETVKLADVIIALRQEIADLKDQVAKLASK